MISQTRAYVSDSDVRTSGSEATTWWGATMAGVFVILASLVLFAELGAAIGLSSFDPGDRLGAYALGAGIWSLLAGIVCFFLGGFAAAACARPRRKQLGMWNGTMVWCVAVTAIGLLAAVLAIGATTAGAAVTTAAAATDVATEGAVPVLPRGTLPRGTETPIAPPTAGTVERAAEAAGAVGWGMVAALFLTLGASVLGGFVGTRYGAAAVRQPLDGRHDDFARREGLPVVVHEDSATLR